MKRCFAVCVGLACLSSLAFAADPLRPSANQQVELGTRAATDIRKKEKVLPDSDPRVQLVRRVGDRIVATFKAKEKDKPWKFSFDVIEDKTVNAFALPGGPMFVYTGLLSKFKTEDELAAVLGHELTHVRKEHWARQYADSTKRQMGLMVLLLVFKANNTISNIANISNQAIIETKFSRDHESEADSVGMESMVSANYNPEGMADTFRLLEKEAGSGRAPEFISDHPSDKRRIQTIEDKIKAMNRSFGPQIPLDEAIVNPKDPKKDGDGGKKKKSEAASEHSR